MNKNWLQTSHTTAETGTSFRPHCVNTHPTLPTEQGNASTVQRPTSSLRGCERHAPTAENKANSVDVPLSSQTWPTTRSVTNAQGLTPLWTTHCRHALTSVAWQNTLSPLHHLKEKTWKHYDRKTCTILPSNGIMDLKCSIKTAAHYSVTSFG